MVKKKVRKIRTVILFIVFFSCLKFSPFVTNKKPPIGGFLS